LAFLARSSPDSLPEKADPEKQQKVTGEYRLLRIPLSRQEANFFVCTETSFKVIHLLSKNYLSSEKLLTTERKCGLILIDFSSYFNLGRGKVW